MQLSRALLPLPCAKSSFREHDSVKRIAVFIAMCLLANSAAADGIVVLDVRHRQAAELVEVLRPLLTQDEAISASGNQLILRADAAGIARIKEALAQLDRSRRQVQITVRRASVQTIEHEALAARVRAGGDRGLRVQAYGTSNNVDVAQAGVSRVLVDEGSEAFVGTGGTVPQVGGAVIETRQSGNRVFVGAEMRELHSGFRIVPRLSGNHIELDISEQQEHAEGELISTQRASSHVSGELGAWLPLGGVAAAASRTNATLLGHALSTQEDDVTWWVRVDEVKQ